MTVYHSQERGNNVDDQERIYIEALEDRIEYLEGRLLEINRKVMDLNRLAYAPRWQEES